MVMKRGRGRVLLECKYRPAQIILIVEREGERNQEAWLLDLLNTNFYQTCVVSLCGVFMIFSLIID